MTKILLAYATNAGSTADVAKVIGEELGAGGAQVDVRPIAEISSVDDYDAVVVGAPMIMGWHPQATKFIKKHQSALSSKRVAYFFTAVNLTQSDETQVDGVPIWVDARQAKPPKDKNRLGFKEGYALPANYLRPALKDAPLVKPLSVGFFGGKLEMFRLPILQMLFVMLIIQADGGDFRHWALIREWAGQLRSTLGAPQPAA